jgi:membrane-bound lytic murein transglycosylase A
MQLEPLEFSEISGWSTAEAAGAWPAFRASCEAVVARLGPLRSGVSVEPALFDTCKVALGTPDDPAAREAFFRSRFQPHRVRPKGETGAGFVTGYYEPEIAGALERSERFSAPILSRPSNLIDMRDAFEPGWDRASEGAMRDRDGRLTPYPDRAAIEAGAIDTLSRPILWLEDHVEVFFVQVQGSARVRLPGGDRVRLVYDGRNGRPYTSIGRAVIERGHILAEEMSLSTLKIWLKGSGLGKGQPGREILHLNRSYVFFRLEPDTDPNLGPIGGQGAPLTAMRSIAVDRNVWPYATPVWISADLSSAGLPAERPGTLMVAQDTGSAIVGPARGDLFIGSGAAAGEIAGRIRHPADFIVFLPRAS